MPLFIDNLKTRVKYIKHLCDKIRENDIMIERRFWIPGFFSQKNFLTTLVQEASRKKNMSIEQFEI